MKLAFKMATAGVNGSAMLSTSILAEQCKDWDFSTRGHLDKLWLSRVGIEALIWFAVVDKEWCFLRYLSKEKFVENQLQQISLASLTEPLLYKVDE